MALIVCIALLLLINPVFANHETNRYGRYDDEYERDHDDDNDNDDDDDSVYDNNHNYYKRYHAPSRFYMTRSSYFEGYDDGYDDGYADGREGKKNKRYDPYDVDDYYYRSRSSRYNSYMSGSYSYMKCSYGRCTYGYFDPNEFDPYDRYDRSRRYYYN